MVRTSPFAVPSPVASILLALFALGGCTPGGGGGGAGGGTPPTDAGADGATDAEGMCTPDCAGRVCGADGCGGSCGACPEGEVCGGGACGPVPASCGDGTCGDDETCETCEADCGACCGDGTCTAAQGENCTSCAADCGCAEGERCDGAGACVAECAPDCEGRACGSDGCGGDCGACAEGVCDAGGQCVAPPEGCGDGACGAGEDCSNCADDCGCEGGQVCDRGVCVADCPDDCGEAWTAACTVDGFGYRLCVPDTERPGCTAPSRRILCGNGRACEAGEAGDACGGRCLRPEVLVLVDRSSSMEGERWAFTRSVLLEMASETAEFVRLGLRVFPGEADGCTAGPVVVPTFDAGAAFEAMPAPAQDAQTPIASAIDGLGDAFGDPDEGESVILLTDGDETCAGEFDAVETAAALRSRGVRTFVIGIGREANGDLLSAIAEAGGTAALGAAPYQAVEDGPGLRAAFGAIFGWLDVGRAEACNGGDDDCDGRIDEALPPLLGGAQDGVCAGALLVCDGEWREPDYAAIEGYEAEEATCDALDNDCDGRIDEALDAPAAAVQDGVCGGAVQVCAAGWIEPDYARIDGYEADEVSCDGRDNDCDGALDEALEAPLAEVQAGICEGASRVCDGAWLEPDYGALPGHEAPEASCDGRDNDCDGRIDEQLDPPLADRQAGVCAGATRVCAGRWAEPDYGRIDRYEAVEETCEGLDNDCDGRVDEGVPCPVICGPDEFGPPCNRCPPGTVVPPGFVCIPAGQFTIGSPDDEEGRAGDERQVDLTMTRPFLIEATETTRDAWSRLVPDDPGLRHDCAAGDGEDGECPIASLTWFEAAAYANARTAAARANLTPCYVLDGCRNSLGRGLECDVETLEFDPACTGYRLPTEAEWEYATRAGRQSRFWMGDATLDLLLAAWYAANSDDLPHPVGLRAANGWGLYDVHGNVREWVNDWYDPGYFEGGTVDRIGPAAGAFKVHRGGAYDDAEDDARSADRVRWLPESTSRSVGLRLARWVVDTPCGDGVCDPGEGEHCDSCPADCGCPAGLACVERQCIECVAECGDRVCGDDGCGGSCGGCPAGDICADGACAPAGLVLIVDEATPISEGGDMRVTALVPAGFDNGRVEDAHGRFVAAFQPTGDPEREEARVTWAAFDAFEPLDGGRRERRALYAAYDRGGATARTPFTMRIVCPATQLCLGTCIARNDPCDRSCADGCGGAQACIDRQCVDLVDGVALAGLRPRNTGLVPGDTVPRGTKGAPLAVHLDRPAPAGGVTVRLESLDGTIEVPAEVVVPAGEASAAIEVQAFGSTHGAGIIARLGGQARHGEIRTVPAPAVGSRLIINEIDYDQPGADGAEFVELHNPTDVEQPVAGLALLFVNGDDDGDPYITAPLDALVTVPARGYVVIGDDIGLVDGWLEMRAEMQGGDSDGVLLVDTVSGAVLDAFAYDGYLLGVTEGGRQNLDLRGDRAESFSRCPDGVDGNDNATDFVQVLPTPGQPNACP